MKKGYVHDICDRCVAELAGNTGSHEPASIDSRVGRMDWNWWMMFSLVEHEHLLYDNVDHLNPLMQCILIRRTLCNKKNPWLYGSYKVNSNTPKNLSITSSLRGEVCCEELESDTSHR